MNLPGGVINIIIDYAHTLFYIEELKNKTADIYYRTKINSGDLCYFFGALTIFHNVVDPNNPRYKLLEKENERRLIFGIKEEELLWPGSSRYNRNYQSY